MQYCSWHEVDQELRFYSNYFKQLIIFFDYFQLNYVAQ